MNSYIVGRLSFKHNKFSAIHSIQQLLNWVMNDISDACFKLPSLNIMSRIHSYQGLALPSTCTKEYEALNEAGKIHTMCNSKYNANPDATNRSVSDTDKKTIVDVHNKYRGGVEPQRQTCIRW